MNKQYWNFPLTPIYWKCTSHELFYTKKSCLCWPCIQAVYITKCPDLWQFLHPIMFRPLSTCETLTVWPMGDTCAKHFFQSTIFDCKSNLYLISRFFTVFNTYQLLLRDDGFVKLLKDNWGNWYGFIIRFTLKKFQKDFFPQKTFKKTFQRKYKRSTAQRSAHTYFFSNQFMSVTIVKMKFQLRDNRVMIVEIFIISVC